MVNQVAQREAKDAQGAPSCINRSLLQLEPTGTPPVSSDECHVSSPTGSKRKIEEVNGQDDTPSPLTSKKQLLGLTFFTSALFGLFPIQKILKSIIGKTPGKEPAEPDEQVPEEQLQAAVSWENTADTPSAPVAPQPKESATLSLDQERIGAYITEEKGDVALDDVDAGAEEDVPVQIAAAPVIPALTLIKRPQGGQYISPLMKPIKVIKRSELRRQLQEKLDAASRASSTPTAVSTPKARFVPASSRPSRGARLRNIASSISAEKVRQKTSFFQLQENAKGAEISHVVAQAIPEGDESHQGICEPASCPEAEKIVNEVSDPEIDVEASEDVEEARVDKHVVVAAAVVGEGAAPSAPSPEIVVGAKERVQNDGAPISQPAQGHQMRLTESPCNFLSVEEDAREVSGARKQAAAAAAAAPPLVDSKKMVVEDTPREGLGLSKIDQIMTQVKDDGVLGNVPEDDSNDKQQHQSSNRFVRLPPLMTDADSDNGDGLWALDSPVANIFPVSAAASKEAQLDSSSSGQQQEWCSEPVGGGEIGWTPKQEATKLAVMEIHCGCDSSGRRVRFIGVDDGNNKSKKNNDVGCCCCGEGHVQHSGVDLEGASPEVETCIPVSSIPNVEGPGGDGILCNNNSDHSVHSVLRSQPRFDPGAFVGMPSTDSPGALTRSQTKRAYESSSEDGSAVLQGARRVEENGELPFLGASTADPTGPGETPVIISRRLHTVGRTGLRRTILQNQLLPQISLRDAATQKLREAFLNSRLAECWRQGEAWARLDLSGVEIDVSVDHTAAVETASASLAALTCQQRGQTTSAFESALEQLRAEWEHLRNVRQRYVGSPAVGGTTTTTVAAPGAPRSILKHVSAITPSPSAAPDTTPLACRRFAAGFDDILAADIVPLGSNDSPILRRGGGGGGRAALHTDLTLARTRGNRMLASLQQGPTLPMDSPACAAAPPGITQQRPLDDDGSADPPPAPYNYNNGGQELRQGIYHQVHQKVKGRKAPRNVSRGQRLLQALQNAATSITDPPAAVATGALVVEPAASAVPDMVDGCTVATTFITAT